ncbi:MAG: DinB family protein [Candidatus Hodarchaeales archaeon]
MNLTYFSSETLADYNRLMDNKIIEIIENLTDKEYYKDLESNIGSIHKKCAHIASFADFFVHVLDDSLDTPQIFPDLSGLSRTNLISKWKTDDKKLVKLIKQKQGTHDVTLVGGMKATMDLEHIHFDAIDHASYHRGQIMICLRLLGKQTVNTDYLMWLSKTETE